MKSVNCSICILHDAKEDSVIVVSGKDNKVTVKKYKKKEDEVNYTRWMQAVSLTPIQRIMRFGASAIFYDEI